MNYYIPISTFPNQLCNPHRFKLELAAALPGKNCSGVTSHDNQVVVDIETLDVTEQGTMSYMASIHTGEKVPDAYVLTATRLKEEAFIIENHTEWQVIAGTIARPLFFHPVPEEIIAQVVGEVRTLGAGCEMRLVESTDGQSDQQMTIEPWQVPDTEGAWIRYNYTSQIPPREGLNNYQVEARLDGATAMAIRYTSMTMLKVI